MFQRILKMESLTYLNFILVRYFQISFKIIILDAISQHICVTQLKKVPTIQHLLAPIHKNNKRLENYENP